MRQKWSEEEVQYLLDSYTEATPEKLQKDLSNRSWDAIKLKANNLGLSKSQSFRRQGSLSPLLQDNAEAFYWMGFILADGCIMQPSYRLKISLSKKDESHLKKLACFLSTKTHPEKTCISLRVQDKDHGPLICSKFGIQEQKTYNPPDKLIESDQNLVFALLCGFIDGDGSIQKLHNRPDYSLRVKCHASWVCILNEFASLIEAVSGIEVPRASVNSQGYADISIGNSQVLKAIKRKAMELDLPLMNRKWSVIDLEYVSRIEQAAINRSLIIELANDGFMQKEIAEKLDLSPACVSTTLSRYRKRGE